VEGEVQALREALAVHEAHEERADEAGAGRGGDRAEVVDGDARFLQGVLHDGVDAFDVFAAREFRHDAAVRGVHGLRPDAVGAHGDVAVRVEFRDADAGVVAARVDPEDEGHASTHRARPVSALLVCASVRVSWRACAS